MESAKEARQLVANEILNTNNYYLVKIECEECGDFLCTRVTNELELIVFTEQAFNILNINNDLLYIKRKNLKEILDIASRIKVPSISFSTSNHSAVSFLVSQFA